jgi:RasGEF domain/RasGEF N-terminal motif
VLPIWIGVLTEVYDLANRPLVESGSRRRHGKSLAKVTLHTPASSTNLPPPRPTVGPDARHSIWSSSQFSELRPNYTHEEIEEANNDVSDSEPRHRRAHSFSTISEYEQSAASDGGDEFRIVIDRFDTNKPSNGPIDGSPMPALEVPIPHYRLGTLQFNTEGSPVLRSSIYTHTSVSENTHSSIYLKDNTVGSGQNRIPSTYDSPGLTPPEGTLSMAMSLFSGVTPSSAKDRHSNSTQRSGIYTLRHPIEPSVFNILAKNMDDATVVKYIPNTRDISAATPARIVVQISSESFMDYELVSDFFLTFRSYLSTTNLLSLLLARLEWAINRLQADGRIIRIRTFAALRHWILNYFADDFVSNRDLRVQFCDQINNMYADVKARRTAGVSDVKILVDLKRCWHGRCTMYWDSLPFTSPDNLALPGGDSEGKAFINKNGSSEVGSSSQGAVTSSNLSSQSLVQSTNSIEAERTPNGRIIHTRTISSGTSRSVPGSSSEQSVQALSCSFPSKSASISMGGLDAPHPVVVSIQPSPRSPTSSATSRPPAHVHKRSGSFSDSIRDDRAPLSRALVERYEQEQALLPTSDGGNGSLIRGNLFPPIDAGVVAIVPPSPTISQTSDELREHHARSASEGNIRAPGTSPALKTVIGSIRRALHPRHLGANTAPHTGSPTFRSPRGKTATLPVNVAFKSDTYKNRKTFPKSNIPFRTDYICEQSMIDYREAIGLNPPQSSTSFAIERLRGLGNPTAHLRAHDVRHQRLVSEVTMGSKSIVIVDDTGLDLPVVSGGIDWLDREQINNADSSSSSTRQNNHMSSGTGIVPFAASPEIFEHERDNSASQSFDLPLQRPLRPPGLDKSRSISSRLRKYASFQSGISRSLGAASETGSVEDGKKPLGRLLRRRPGGDLRKIQNVHDLAPDLRPQSFATDTSLTESLASSVRNYFSRSFSRASQTRTQSTPPRFDLINTHSSQHLRPSFEAAISGFSRIPDDTDGGIESTLLKLEGKWPSPTLSDSRATEDRIHDSQILQHYGERGAYDSWAGTSNLDTYPMTSGETVVTANLQDLPAQSYTDSVAESEFSYNSIPLLERGLSDDSMKKPVSVMHAPITSHPLLQQGPPSSNMNRVASEVARQDLDMLPDRNSPAISHENSDDKSELSSEISIDLIERDETLERPSTTDSLATQSLEMPHHPLAHPPSPPITIQQTVTNSPYREPGTAIGSRNLPTPGSSPTRVVDRGYVRDEITGVGNKTNGLHIEVPKVPDHVPFILAYDSRLLAQQFTVVEKSALDEVDWKDLVDMKWNNNSPSIVSWVHFLAEKERKGIDIVVGRFNLMVKWVLSEVVLTRDIQERARTVAKFIHIAAHARQMCNYSTMLQIAIALSSVDCTRLQRTWALVSLTDRRLLDGMESLIQPLRNFHELRVEMETTNLQNGCIPFVGLYVHDLTYNAQKPSQIAGTRDGDALVNFERYRTSARIVKCLLRLIDASNKYYLEPVPGLVEKCLWIGSLPEDQIHNFSKNLE